MSEAARKPHHVTVAEKLIGQLREGTAPWQKPWEPGTPGGMMPQNPVTGKRYNGINVLQLLSENRSDPRWVTFNQASSQGWRVRRGEKATPVQFWKFTEQVDKTDDQGKPVLNDKGQQEKETVKLDRPQVHWAFVFNAEQLDGIPPREVKEPVWNKLERAEAIFKASGAEVVHDQADSAFYRRSTDKIHMPPEGQFGSADKYYATKFHELGHWTGSDTRLNRDVGNNPFGSEEYAKEELRAEIASMIIGDELGLGHDPDQHAAYVKSWIRVLENDPMEIFRAAADAEKIQKFVLGFEQQQELVQSAYIQSPSPVGTPERGAALAPVLLEHGAAHYDFNDKEKMSYYVKTRSETGEEKTQWGVDLNRAMQESGAEIGDPVTLKNMGQQPVEVDVNIYGVDKKTVIGVEKQTVMRNTWEVTIAPALEPTQQANQQKARDGAAEATNMQELPQAQGAPVPVSWRYQACQMFDEEMASRIDDPDYDRAQKIAWTLNQYNEMSFEPSPREQAILAERKPAMDEAVQWVRDNVLLNPVVKEKMYEMVRDYGRYTGDVDDDKQMRDYLAEMEGKHLSQENQQDDTTVAVARSNAPITPLESEAAAALQESRRLRAEGDYIATVSHQEETLSPSLERAFGQVVILPSSWTGNIQIRGAVIDANGEVEEATAGQAPKFFGLYAENERGLRLWAADCPDLEKAENLAGRLRLIDTHSNREKSENIVAEKTPIKVPFKEKNEAKALGALWDGKAVTWYVPPGVDLNLFKKWTAAEEQQQTGQSQAEPSAALSQAPQSVAAPASQAVPTPEQAVTASATPAPVQTSKQFLAVPYGEREAAKSLGARWDKAAGSWYIGADADPEKLKRWTPDAIAEQKKMTPEEEFRDACESAGLVLRGKGKGQTLDGLPEMDGKRYRVPLVDDKPGDKNGVYIGHLDGHPAGFIQNYRTGVKQNWKSKGYSLTDDERANLNADAAIKMQARQQAQAAEYQEAATKVEKALTELSKPKSTTVYLEAKGVQLHDGVLTDRGGKRTYIPAQDSTGKVWTMQYIREDGSKRFPKGSKKEGCFHVVGGMEALKAAPVLAIGEGYATMSTATEALGFPTVAAFDSGNLKIVAASLKELFPDKPILFVGDDDVASAARSPSGINAGRMKAESAAKELGGQVIFPSFAPGELQSGLSDFNDLATRSELGRDAVTRQLKGALKLTLDAKQQQQREVTQEKTVERDKAPKAAGFSR